MIADDGMDATEALSIAVLCEEEVHVPLRPALEPADEGREETSERARDPFPVAKSDRRVLVHVPDDRWEPIDTGHADREEQFRIMD
jgi:hypothetical protein